MRVIAIDGPAGSGKSTVARRLAERLDLAYLDTGAMYRAVAFAALRRGLDPEELRPVARMVRELDIDLDGTNVRVDGVDATIDIRSPEVTRAVSAVAANPSVRTELICRQRAWVKARGGAVVEGRDIGTVVFPEASFKAYMTARLDVRAGRRHREVGDLAYEAVAADMARRDALDSERVEGPLLCSDDAVRVDTSDRDVEAIVEELLEKLGSGSA